MSASARTVLAEDRGPIRIITLNEPDRLNPIGDETRVALLAALTEADADAQVRVIVLTGAGGNFSAGADVRQLAEMGEPNPSRSKRRMRPLQDAVRLLAGGAKPAVAAVEGAAFGAGLSLVAACDWVVAAEGARFGAAFGRIGLAPDCGLLWSLPQRIGGVLTRDLIFTGRPVAQDEALRIGLADQPASASGALDLALAKAEQYLGTAPLTIAATKTALAELPGALDRALGIEAHQQPMLSMSADHREARDAFMAKRKPEFRGR